MDALLGAEGSKATRPCLKQGVKRSRLRLWHNRQRRERKPHTPMAKGRQGGEGPPLARTHARTHARTCSRLLMTMSGFTGLFITSSFTLMPSRYCFRMDLCGAKPKGGGQARVRGQPRAAGCMDACVRDVCAGA